MSNPFFNNRQYPRRQGVYGQPRYKTHPNSNFFRPKSSMMNFSDNFSSSDSSSILHNSTMSNNSYRSDQFSRDQSLLDSNMSLIASDRPSFSSLFTANSSESSSKPLLDPFNHPSYGSSSLATSLSPPASTAANSNNLSSDDDGVYLQISNLDQWYDEANLRNYLMNQLKPITPILALTIETPSIAKVKVPSTQFAKQVVSHLHRKKMGHKRIFVSFLKDKTSAECSALRNKVIGLLRDVPSHELQMCKFRELFQSRFKSSISILDLYKMSDIVDISIGENEEKTIALKLEFALALDMDASRSEQAVAPYSTYCIEHYKPDKNKGWAEIEIEPLPNVMMSIKDVQSIILPLLRKHRGEIPIASLLYCLEAELGVSLTKNDHGVALEHLVSAVPGVEIKYNDYGIKILNWHDELANSEDVNSSLRTSLNLSHGEAAETISKEVIELVKMCSKSTMMFSKFIPTYHNHFGKQCRVADYGCTKLIELFEAMSSIVQVLGEGESRQITLSHRTQLRRFSIDMFKVLRAQPSKSLQVANLSQAYLTTHNRIFDVTDYGVCYIEDLLDGLRNNNNNSFITVSRKRGDETKDVFLYIQKRRQSNAETEKTSCFAGEVVELLRNSPQFSILFRKFVRSYHYFFGYQCKLSDYGYVRLAELLEALHGIVEMDANNEENKKITLSRKVALRIFAEQLQNVIKEMTGKSGTMAKVDDVLECYKNQLGYQMQGSSLGYGSVIDALKFVPFIEMSSFNNELWITNHLENEKFRQRALMACMVIVDIGSKVPLAKFNSIFVDKFKFSIGEKSLHAMKHAVEIEMVNGVKMISLTALMKFLMHIVNILEHKPRMSIGEIKSTMKLNLASTFNLGYPNLASVVKDFPDIFVMKCEEKGTKDCFDVELSAECPLTHSGIKKILDKKRVQQPDEKPEMFTSPKINSKLPPKMRCIQKPSNQLPSSIAQQQPPQLTANNAHEQYYRNLQMYSDQYYRGNLFAHSSLPDVTLNGAAMSANVANQLFNYQMQQQQQQQQKFHASAANPFADNVDKLTFLERNLRMQQQQQQQLQQAMKQQDYINNVSFGAASTSSFDNEIPYSMMGNQSSFSSSGRFSAPKPETPPSSTKPCGLWLDPVWNCDGSLAETNRAGAAGSSVDAVKGFNFHVVSPFLSFKTMFTFDNPNNQSN